ncbi:MAG: hypothetical protein ACYTG7_15385 [Planctomycetota bacterium]|jgi:hypothetical protein
MRFGKYIFFVLWVAALLLPATAAGDEKLQDLGARVSEQEPKGFMEGKIAVEGGLVEGTFDFTGQLAELECNVTIEGILEGEPFTKTVAVSLGIQGQKGAAYKLRCRNALLVQCPEDARNFSGTYDGGADQSGQLIIEEGFDYVYTGPGQVLHPEEGHGLVFLRLPDEIPPALYSLNLHFDLDSNRAIQMKPILIGEITCEEVPFLSPIIPFEADNFSTLPAVTVPVSNSFVELVPDLVGVGDQVKIRIDCRRSIDVPALTPWGTGIMVAVFLLIGGAVTWFRRL